MYGQVTEQAKVLIVEDDFDIAKLVVGHLRDCGYLVDHAENGAEASRLVARENYDLAILDIMFPGGDGFTFCRALREKRADIGIVMLTCKSDELDKVLGLEIGADDYIVKPFSLRELIARIRAVLRRKNGAAFQDSKVTPQTINIGDLQINLAMKQVLKSGAPIELTAREFNLLEFLASDPGRVYSIDDLLLNVWGYNFEGYGRTVISHINRLRNKLGDVSNKPVYIKTIRGAGYRFVTEAELKEETTLKDGSISKENF